MLLPGRVSALPVHWQCSHGSACATNRRLRWLWMLLSWCKICQVPWVCSLGMVDHPRMTSVYITACDSSCLFCMCRAEEAAAEARRQEAVASIHRRRQSAASSLPPEPSDDEPTAAVRVRLPDGSNHNRRFAAGNTVRQLYAWVDSLEECDYAKYSLVCGFPRKVYGPDSLEQTLEAAGLAPQGVLFVQQEDDDEEGQQ